MPMTDLATLLNTRQLLRGKIGVAFSAPDHQRIARIAKAAGVGRAQVIRGAVLRALPELERAAELEPTAPEN